MAWLRLIYPSHTACQPHHMTVAVIYNLPYLANFLFHIRRLTTGDRQFRCQWSDRLEQFTSWTATRHVTVCVSEGRKRLKTFLMTKASYDACNNQYGAFVASCSNLRYTNDINNNNQDH